MHNECEILLPDTMVTDSTYIRIHIFTPPHLPSPLSRSDVALLYNDRAVLENHHISAAFRIMKEEECNILNNLKREEYRDFRSLVIDMVLATDMSYHFQQIKNMKNLLSMPEK